MQWFLVLYSDCPIIWSSTCSFYGSTVVCIYLYIAGLSLVLFSLGFFAFQYAESLLPYEYGLDNLQPGMDETKRVSPNTGKFAEVLCAWMASNRLQMNPGKTQFIWLCKYGQFS